MISVTIIIEPKKFESAVEALKLAGLILTIEVRSLCMVGGRVMNDNHMELLKKIDGVASIKSNGRLT